MGVGLEFLGEQRDLRLAQLGRILCCINPNLRKYFTAQGEQGNTDQLADTIRIGAKGGTDRLAYCG